MTRIANEAAAAYEVLRRGGVVLLPTDVGFGLVACGDAAIAKIYELKGRPHSKPCVTVADAVILDDVAQLPDASTRAWAHEVAARLPIALVNHTRRESKLLAGLSDFALGQVTTGGTIATFLNAGVLVNAIAQLALPDGMLVFGSSANLARQGNSYGLDEVPAEIRDHVDLVIEGPRARYAHPKRLATTILDMTTGGFLREGIEFDAIAIAWQSRQAAWRAGALG